MNGVELRIEMLKKNIGVKALCKKIDMKPATFYRKLRAGTFDQGNIASIRDALDLSMEDIKRIFLP